MKEPNVRNFRAGRSARTAPALAAICALVLAGCATAPRYKMLTDKRYPPRPSSYPIELYATGLRTPHEEIAIIDSVGFDKLTSATRKAMVEDLRARARNLGADAVKDVRMLISPQRGWVLDPQTPFRSWRQGWRDVYFLRGRAVRFKPLLVESGKSIVAGEKFNYAEGERPKIETEKEKKKDDLEIYEIVDRRGRRGFASRSKQPKKLKLPSIEIGD